MLRAISIARCAALCVALGAIAPGPVQATDFLGGGGAIPDAQAAGVDIPIQVAGFTAPIETIRIAVNLTHPYAGDLRATLISPGGTARLILFSRVGYKRASSTSPGSNFAGTYTFDDASTGNLWSALNGADIAGGSYRSSTGGFSGLSDHGGCATFLTLAFGGLTGTDVNGTWTLNVADLAGNDVGTVNAVLLSIDPEPQVSHDGFEEDVAPSGLAAGSRDCVTSYYDFTGSGLASYAVVRNTGGGPMGAITWFVKDNNGGNTGATDSFVLGIATDFFLEGDYDGDGIGDATVWRSGTIGRYYVRRSSRPSQVLEIPFGRSGDDVQQLGDYDGDGITDLAYYRGGASAGQPSFFTVRYSGSGKVRTFQAGENGYFPAGGSDFDGDGKADFSVQNNVAQMGHFRMFGGLDGVQFDEFDLGLPTDVIVTGSHTGSDVGDTTVVRGVLGKILWTTRDGETGVVQPGVEHGESATDFPLSGDFDGDGLYDYAVWRPNADPLQTRFIVRKSGNPAVPFEVQWGQNGDYPPANGRTH